MGLDIFLGVMIFGWAIRGWFKGFLRQSIAVGALIACVYVSDPLRDLARPHAREYLPAVAPDILDRLLWWGLAASSYLVMSGTGVAILKASRRKAYGEPEPNRTDQGAGFALGALKGFVLASFLVAGISRFAPGYLKPGGFADDQAKASRALDWADRHRPADKIWTSVPVQAFVTRVRTRGMWGDAPEKPPAAEKPEAGPLDRPETAHRRKAEPSQTASNPPKTMVIRRLDPNSPTFDRDFDAELRREGLAPDRR